MSVRVEYKPDYLAYVVVRYRGDVPSATVLTNKGWVPRKEGEAFKFDESMLWEPNDLSDLVSQLAKLDIKPKEASYTEGLLNATNRHLDDMRTLVFKKKT